MSAWNASETGHMQTALALARTAAGYGEIPVGAVVVQGDDIIGQGYNRTITDRDPSAHAEIVALRDAAARIGNHRLVDAALIVTLEPCVMCFGALVQARVQRLLFGAYDPKAGAAGSVLDLGSERRLNHRMEISGGLLHEECGVLLQAFFRARRKRG